MSFFDSPAAENDFRLRFAFELLGSGGKPTLFTLLTLRQMTEEQLHHFMSEFHLRGNMITDENAHYTLDDYFVTFYQKYAKQSKRMKFFARIGYLPGVVDNFVSQFSKVLSAAVSAVKNGHSHIVKFFIENVKSDIHRDNIISETYYWAASSGNFDLVQFLYDKVPCEEARRDGFTAMYTNQHSAVIRFAMAQPNFDFNHCFHVASICSKVYLFEIFLGQNLWHEMLFRDFVWKNSDSISNPSHPMMSRFIEVVKLFLERGVRYDDFILSMIKTRELKQLFRAYRKTNYSFVDLETDSAYQRQPRRKQRKSRSTTFWRNRRMQHR